MIPVIGLRFPKVIVELLVEPVVIVLVLQVLCSLLDALVPLTPLTRFNAFSLLLTDADAGLYQVHVLLLRWQFATGGLGSFLAASAAIFLVLAVGDLLGGGEVL